MVVKNYTIINLLENVASMQLTLTQENFNGGNKCEVRSSEAGHLADWIT